MPARVGRKGSFRYLDAHGREIQDAATLERIEGLAIPPAWTDVWITALRKRHVWVRGHRVRLEFVGKGRSQVRTSLVDDELAAAIKELLAVPGRGRLFRYESNGNGRCDLTSRTLNEYVKTHLGDEF